MNWDELEGKWHQIKGSIRAKWGDLTDDEIEQIDGKREVMVGMIQEKLRCGQGGGRASGRGMEQVPRLTTVYATTAVVRRSYAHTCGTH